MVTKCTVVAFLTGGSVYAGADTYDVTLSEA
jgi:hypothetical protein